MDDRKQPTGPPSLVGVCVTAVVSADYWRVQRRSLAYLPEHIANLILDTLLRQYRVGPPQLELFKYSATTVRLHASNGIGSGISWLSHIAEYRFLRELSVTSCPKLRDTAVASLVGVKESLKALSLHGCKAITDFALPAITQLQGLTFLDLSDTGLNYGIPALSSLICLLHLELGGVPVTDQHCVSLAKLTALQRIELWGTAISDQGVAHFQAHTALRTLNIAWTSVQHIPTIPSLQHVHMGHTQLERRQDDTAVTLLPSLLTLRLTSSVLYSHAAYNQLPEVAAASACSLTKLDLSRCKCMTDISFLTQCLALQQIDLTGTQVTDAGLHGLHHLSALKKINLSDTAITCVGVEQIIGCSALEHLNLAHTKISDAVFALIHHMPSLLSLDLSGSHISGYAGGPTATAASPQELNAAPLTQLTQLKALGTMLTDKGCRVLLGMCPNVIVLKLGSNFLTDASCSAIASLIHVEHVTLVQAPILDHGLSQLRSAPSLSTVDILSCHFVTAEGAVQLLRSCPSLTKVVLNGKSISDTRMESETRDSFPGTAHRDFRNCSSSFSGWEEKRYKAKGKGGVDVGLHKVGWKGKSVAGSELVKWDERTKYSREELMEMRSLSSAGGDDAAGLVSSGVLSLIPRELRTV